MPSTKPKRNKLSEYDHHGNWSWTEIVPGLGWWTLEIKLDALCEYGNAQVDKKSPLACAKCALGARKTKTIRRDLSEVPVHNLP